jgi:threonine dehydrogenase-like Zn-dependent dehydrogenase
MFGCGACAFCERGNYNLCSRGAVDVLGCTVPGGMAEYFRAPSRVLVPLPEGLAPEDACLVEPGSVAWHACVSGGVGPDARVAVVGGGAIGLLAVAAARRLGAPEVALEARYPHQRELGERFGATEPTGLYDVVIETAGSESAFHRCMELIRPQGTVSTIGVFEEGVSWPWMTALVKEARTVTAIGYAGDAEGREFEKVAAMLAEDPDLAASLITHRFGIEDAVEAFDVARERAAGTRRVVVHP